MRNAQGHVKIPFGAGTNKSIRGCAGLSFCL